MGIIRPVVVVLLPPSRIARRVGVRISTFNFIFSTVLLVAFNAVDVPSRRRRPCASSASNPELLGVDSRRPSAHIHDSRAATAGGICELSSSARASH